MTIVQSILTDAAIVICLTVTALVAFTAASIRRAERLVPPDGRFIDVAGGRLHYTDEGRGDAVVLIHGLGGQLRNFASPLIDRLVLRHRVIAVDRPGSGYSSVTGQYPDLNRQAVMVAELIDKLGIGSAVMVGHSLGGALALSLVQARPDLVSMLALVAPLTQHQEDAPRAFKILTIRSAAIRLLVGWTIVAPFGRFAGRSRRGPVFAPDALPTDFESRGGGALVYRPRGFDAASRDIQGVPAALPAICSGYAAIRRPVQVLFGRGDRILDPTVHGENFIRQVPGAELSLSEGGHMLPFTRPKETAAWIEAAIERTAA